MSEKNTTIQAPPVQPPVAANPPREKTVQERLAELELRKLEKEFAAEEEKRVNDLAVRKANALAIQNKREQDLRKQTLCSHRKDNGQTAYGGQRASDNITYYVCQNCGKEETSLTIPPQLRPDPSLIGGPQY